MREFSHIDQVKIVRSIMEWMIDDFAVADIISQLCVKWTVDETQANHLLQLALGEWKKNERENNEQKRLRKIESLKKLKRSLKDTHKGTPAGISAILSIEKELFRLESLGSDSQSAGVEEKKLTAKQEAFCREYVIDFNGTQAYKRAGYSASTDDIASVESHKLLRKPKLTKYIEELKAEARRRTDLDTDMIIDELRDLSDWNIQDYLNADKTIKNLAEMPRNKTKAVSGIKVTERILPDGSKQVTTELKFIDKRAALVDLGRHTGAFTDKIDVTSKGKSIVGKKVIKATLKLT